MQRLKREFILNHVSLHFTSPSSERLLLNRSVQPSTHLSTHASICLSTNSSIQPSMHLSICPLSHPLIHPCTYPSTYSTHPFTPPPTYATILHPFTRRCCVFLLGIHYRCGPATELWFNASVCTASALLPWIVLSHGPPGVLRETMRIWIL